MKRDDLRDVPAYAVVEAAHYLRVPPSTLRAWCVGQAYRHRGKERFFKPVIAPAQPKPVSLSFSNLIEAYVLAAIRRRFQFSLPSIRDALDFLVERLGSERPLLEEDFAVHGVELFVDRLGLIINLTKRGQIEMPELIRAYLSRIQRDEAGLPRKLYVFTREKAAPDEPKTIAIDPQEAFGRPVIDGTGVPTSVLVERFQAGDDFKKLAADYGTSEEAIQDAIRCEVELREAA
jgi:uncharacterized protein (DUF433 family)